MIPKILQRPEFRFVLLKPKTKIPFEKSWQENGYKFNDTKLLEHLEAGGNYGVIGGYGNLRILDIDNKEQVEKWKNEMSETFMVETGSGGLHIYFITDYETNHVLKDGLGEFRANNYQVVGAGCTHPNGNTYRPLNNNLIVRIDKEMMEGFLKPYLRDSNLSEPVRQGEVKDMSRSGLEFRKAIALFRQGKAREEVHKQLLAYKKYADSIEAYQNTTLDNAELFVLNEKEQPKETLQPTEEQLEILKDPQLFEKLNRELDKKIVEEEETRKTILLCSFGRLVENAQVSSYNLLVNSESGAGKDYLVRNTLELTPKEYYIKKTRISPTAFTYWHNSEFEPEWTWNGKVFYAEDIGESVLNSDVFKVMCSSGSSATIVIKQRAIDLEIVGKPVIITTTASASPSPEMVRRFVMLMLDESVDQTEAIMERWSEFKKKGIEPEYNQELIEAQKYLQRVKVIIPFADLIHPHFPKDNIIMRTNYPRFLDFISASASLHQYQRKRENGFILAEGQDYDVARECFLKLFSNKYMISLSRNQREILEAFEQDPKLEGSVSELYNSVFGKDFLSDRALETNLKNLVKFGILRTTIKKDVLNRDITCYSIKKSYTENRVLNIPYYASITSISSISSLSSITSITKSQREGVGVTEDAEDVEAIKGELEPKKEWNDEDQERMKRAGGNNL